MEILVAFIIRLLVFFLEIWIETTHDTGEKVRWEWGKIIIVTLYLFYSAFAGKENGIVVEAVSGFFWGSLAAAAYSDWQIKKAYDLNTFTALVSVVLILVVESYNREIDMWGLFIFIMLQVTIYRFVSGTGDILICIAAGAYLAAFGGGIMDMLLYLPVSGLLGMIMKLLFTGSIKGKTPLIPYLAVGLLVMV